MVVSAEAFHRSLPDIIVCPISSRLPCGDGWCPPAVAGLSRRAPPLLLRPDGAGFAVARLAPAGEPEEERQRPTPYAHQPATACYASCALAPRDGSLEPGNAAVEPAASRHGTCSSGAARNAGRRLSVWQSPSMFRRRHYHETQRGQVVAFAMQLEVEVGDAWVPVVRYDTAHGVPHVHRYETMTHASKQTLEMPAGEALTLAQEDLAQNWSQYRDEFVRRIR